MSATDSFVMNQTMLRVKDPRRTIDFYSNVLGMTLLDQYEFPEAKFSLYFMGYPQSKIPDDAGERIKWVFEQPALMEFTHNWGTEDEPGFAYHDGNKEPQGFGHIGISVPDVDGACARFEELGVEFVKRPDDGSMKGLAFIKDPDGYWIEILSGDNLRDLIEGRSAGS